MTYHSMIVLAIALLPSAFANPTETETEAAECPDGKLRIQPYTYVTDATGRMHPDQVTWADKTTLHGFFADGTKECRIVQLDWLNPTEDGTSIVPLFYALDKIKTNGHKVVRYTLNDPEGEQAIFDDNFIFEFTEKPGSATHEKTYEFYIYIGWNSRITLKVKDDGIVSYEYDVARITPITYPT